MTILMAITIGGLYTVAIYLMLRRSIIKLIFGLALLGHACNLLIFTAGGLRELMPPLIPSGATTPPVGSADPVPQALILTAIVISFAVQAFAAVLFRTIYQRVGTDDIDQMRGSDA